MVSWMRHWQALNLGRCICRVQSLITTNCLWTAPEILEWLGHGSARSALAGRRNLDRSCWCREFNQESDFFRYNKYDGCFLFYFNLVKRGGRSNERRLDVLYNHSTNVLSHKGWCYFYYLNELVVQGDGQRLNCNFISPSLSLSLAMSPSNIWQR